MPFKHVVATGYIVGDANTAINHKIHSVTVFSKTGTGSWKIEGGVSGGDKDLIPGNNAAVATVGTYGTMVHIPIKNPIYSPIQSYATLTNCELLVEYE